MAESLAVALQNATIQQPRAHLAGIPASEIEKLQKRMPSLTEVRKEAGLARKMMNESPPTNCQGMDQSGKMLGVLHPSIAYHFMLPNLYAFSYFCHEDDVPDDLRILCLWALQHKVIAIEEGPEEQLRKILATPEGKILPGSKQFIEGQTRTKIIAYLLSPQINRPEEAMPQIEVCMKLDEASEHQSNDPFLRNAQLYMLYGTTLARTKTRDETAKKVLERILKDIDKVAQGSKLMFIQAKLYLARVLRRMGELDEAKKHETYLITWFKKNPRRIPENTLREWFETETEDDTVLQGLGGIIRLGKRKPTFKALDRQSRQCYNCGLKESTSQKLLRCGKCQYTYYWFVTSSLLLLPELKNQLHTFSSRKCQVENHPYHKIGCAERASEIKRVEALKATAPTDAQCMEDWGLYKNSGFDDVPSYHALGLCHDPNRGKTHIIFKLMEYLPQGGKDVLDRFRVISAGVFRIKDVLNEIEVFLGYNKGEGEQVIKEMLEEFSNGPGKGGRVCPFFNFFISNDKRIETYLSIGGVSVKKLRETKYDPDWRKLLNRSRKYIAEPMGLRSGALDAERDYTPSGSQEEEKSNDDEVAVSSVRPELGGAPQNDNQKKGDSAGTAAAFPRLRGKFK
ncbi:hypothetical protein PQX77_013767 [Marasmius sp. AFHP31]|nr:hypothetical protein PQX77_013767 [Marasmius sp. AFHP31]